MKNSEKESIKTQEKLAKVFKAVISAGLVAPVFVSASACEKAKPAVEEAQAAATISTTIETTPPTTVAETVPPTTETVPETTAEVIINAPAIDGLRFDKETKTYFAEAGNPYGLKVGAEAGFYKPNFLTIETVDGTPGNFDKGVVSLDQSVIKVLQAEALKEKGEYFFPLLVDVRNIDSLGLMELKALDSEAKYLGIRMPVGTKFYSPLEDSDFQLTFASETVYGHEETIMQTFFDIKTKNLEGAFLMMLMNKNLLLANKVTGETLVETNDGKEVTTGNVHLSFGDLIGKMTLEEPLRLWKEAKMIEDKGEPQLLLLIRGKNRSEYKGGLDLILKINNTLISILPEEKK